jgi:hypothetical protein
MRRLQEERAVTQLRLGQGNMAALGSENGTLILDWVDAVPRLLRDPQVLEQVEREAHVIVSRGIREVIWAGMGGSVMTVRVLTDLGYCGQRSTVRIQPLDSTDPAALNAVLREIARRKGMDLESGVEARTLLGDVLMVAVSMGMTSEEPITHLEWFLGLLHDAGLDPADHALVMTLPGSFLDDMARGTGVPTRPLQLDGGTGTPGRFSAPTTRVFLLPAALALLDDRPEPGALRAVMAKAWTMYGLDEAEEHPERHPWVRVAASLADTAIGGCRLLFPQLPKSQAAIFPWIEQLLEESLGKGGKGVVVFPDQPVDFGGVRIAGAGSMPLLSGVEGGAPGPTVGPRADMAERLAALASAFLGWELVVALFGYLNEIRFVGQAAVEHYKARARALRGLADPLEAIGDGPRAPLDGGTLFLPPDAPAGGTASERFADLVGWKACNYLDLTVNGEIPSTDREQIARLFAQVGLQAGNLPVKIRRAPAAYHSTEQMQMDGVPYLRSLRVVSTRHETVRLGSYTDSFLKAQAVATWQAMNEQGRDCALLVLDGSGTDIGPMLFRYLEEVDFEVLRRRPRWAPH